MAKTPIKCVDCGETREVPNACLKLVKRCKPCQAVFNRDAARNRYRKLKGIPLDAPLKKKKKEKSEVLQVRDVRSDADLLGTEDGIMVVQQRRGPRLPQRTPEEEAAEIKKVASLLDLIDDDSTDDDW